MSWGPTRVVLALVALAAVVTFLPARSAADKRRNEHPRARVGLVFDVGGRGDKSFNDAAYLGVSRAEAELGVEVSYLEPSSTEDREAALRLFAARKLDLVIGVGFIFSSDIDAVARAYPDIRFAGVDYAEGKDGVPPNVAALSFREEEGSFLVGAVAGLMSKTGHVGFVGGMTGPLILKFEAGYAAGVAAACPRCTVHAAYAGMTPDAFRDPAKGKALANAQIAAGSDVLYHASGSTGHGVFEAAADARALAIGVDADQHDEMPGVVVTSMIKRVDVAVFETIKAVLEDRFVAGAHVFGLADEGVDYVHEGPHAAAIPAAVKAKVEDLRADVVAGRIHVPKTR
ncbi:MAG: BMP family ABC transporter substrate-binding protein [Labilithrix sp.]|nr:BMP family ABC transporter substrate-binding protein [Labilithrix sp.]MCW5812452.1 BMP family ABC transporter substrate-binding protein [Labilithrix sp.]